MGGLFFCLTPAGRSHSLVSLDFSRSIVIIYRLSFATLMKHSWLIRSPQALLGAVLALSLGFTCPGQETQRQYLSGRGQDDATPWQFFCTAGAKSGQWTTIPVPSNWEMHGFGTLNYFRDDLKKPVELAILCFII